MNTSSSFTNVPAVSNTNSVADGPHSDTFLATIETIDTLNQISSLWHSNPATTEFIDAYFSDISDITKVINQKQFIKKTNKKIFLSFCSSLRRQFFANTLSHSLVCFLFFKQCPSASFLFDQKSTITLVQPKYLSNEIGLLFNFSMSLYVLESFKAYASSPQVQLVLTNKPLTPDVISDIIDMNHIYITPRRALFKSDELSSDLIWTILGINLQFRMVSGVVRRVHARLASEAHYSSQQLSMTGKITSLSNYFEKDGIATITGISDYNRFVGPEFTNSFFELEKAAEILTGNVNQGVFTDLSDIIANTKISANAAVEVIPDIQKLLASATHVTDNAGESLKRVDDKLNDLQTVMETIKNGWTPSGIAASASQTLLDLANGFWDKFMNLIKLVHEFGDLLYPILIVSISQFIKAFLPKSYFGTFCDVVSCGAGIWFGVSSGMRIAEYFSTLRDQIPIREGSFYECSLERDNGKSTSHPLLKKFCYYTQVYNDDVIALWRKAYVKAPLSPVEVTKVLLLLRQIRKTEDKSVHPWITSEMNQIMEDYPTHDTSPDNDEFGSPFFGNTNQGIEYAALFEPIALIYMAFGVDPTKKGEVVTAIKNFPSFKNGAIAVFEALVNIIVRFSGWLSKISGLDVDLAARLDDNYKTWLKKAQIYFVEDNTMTVNLSLRGLAELEVLIDEGIQMATQYEKSNTRILKELTMNHIKLLQKVYVDAKTTARNFQSTRPEPVGLFLSGPAGVGKTVMATMIAHQFCLDLFKNDLVMLERFKQNQKQFIYTRTVEHWYDGYTEDTVVVIHDDVGASAATTPAECEWTKLIDEINVIPKAVPMSEADKKGNIVYGNCLTIVTSNRLNINSQFVVTPSAVLRRLHLPFQIQNKGKNAAKSNYEKAELDIYDCTFLYTETKGWGLTNMKCDLAHVYALVRAKWESNKQFHAKSSAGLDLRTKQFGDAIVKAEPQIFSAENIVRTRKLGISNTLLDDLRKAFAEAATEETEPPGLLEDDSDSDSDDGTDIVLNNRNQADAQPDEIFGFSGHRRGHHVDMFGMEASVTESTFVDDDWDFELPTFGMGGKVEPRITSEYEIYPTSFTYDVGLAVSSLSNFSAFGFSSKSDITMEVYTRIAMGIFYPHEKHVRYLPEFLKLPMPYLFINTDYEFSLGVISGGAMGDRWMDEEIKVLIKFSPQQRIYRAVRFILKESGISDYLGLSLDDFIPAYGAFSEYDLLEWFKGRILGQTLSENVREFATYIYREWNFIYSLVKDVVSDPVTYYQLVSHLVTTNVVHPFRIAISNVVLPEQILAQVSYLSNPIRYRFGQLYRWLQRHKVEILAALGFIISGSLVIKKLFFGEDKEDFNDDDIDVKLSFDDALELFGPNVNQESQGNYQNYTKENKMQTMRNRFKQAARSQKLNAARAVKIANQNEGVNYRVHEEIAPVLKRNFVAIMVSADRKMGSMLCIGGRRYLTPRHYYYNAIAFAIETGSEPVWSMVFDEAVGPIEVPFTKIDVVYDFGVHKDLMLIDFCIPIPERKNILNHFAPSKESSTIFSERLPTIGILNVNSLVITSSVPRTAVVENGILYTNNVIPTTGIIVEEQEGSVVRKDTISYKLTTRQGSCGSLIISGDKIIGMHISGNTMWGHAARITFEDLVTAISDYPNYCGEKAEIKAIFPEMDYDTPRFSNINMGYDVNCHNSGYAIAVAGLPSSVYTKQFMTRYKGFCEFPEPTRVPVHAYNSNFATAREGYKPYDYEIEPFLADAAAVTVGNHLRSIPYGGSFEPYTLRQAIEGIPGTSFKSLDMSTSVGYPENALGLSQKVFFSKNSDGSVTYGPMFPILSDQITLEFDAMATGVIPVFIFTDMLKQELRKIEKIDKPRMISGSNKSMLIHMRMHFGPFTRFCTETCPENRTLIGFNPNVDWDSLERSFIDFGGENRHGAGDYSEFDKRENLDIMLKALQCLEYLAGEWGDFGSPAGKTAALVRKCLVTASVESYHIRGEVIEQWESGWSSGNACTALLNSIANQWMFVYCFGLIKKSDTGSLMAGLNAINVYYEAVFAVFLGDDNRFAVKAGFEWFNMRSLATSLGTLGHVYTDAEKKDKFEELIPRMECSLLKRTPYYHVDLDKWVGLLDFNVITDMLCYTIRGKEIEVIKDRGENAINELAIYPKEKWDQYFPLYCKWIGPFFIPTHFDYYSARRSVLDSPQYQDDIMTRTAPVRTLGADLSSDMDTRFDERIVPLLVVDKQRHQQFTSTTKNYNQMAATPNVTVPPTEVGPNESIEATNVSHNETTIFKDDTIGYVSTGLEQTSLDTRFIDSLTVSSSQSIIDFLMRPAIIASGTFLSGDTGVLYHTEVTNVLTALKRPRINYVYSIKFDMEYTLQVNADRFSAGRYIIGWTPSGGGNLISAGLGSYYAMHMSNTQTITQLPHVEIDLAKQTSVTLKIPFTSIFPSFIWSMTNQAFKYGMGELFIYPYSPLNPGIGEVGASWTLYGSMQNITIGAPSYNQGDEGTREAKAMGVGPVSGVLSRVSKATNILGQIPLIGPYAQSVSWLSKVLAQSASAMGWSKPANLSAPQRMDRRIMPFSANHDMPSTAKPLGVSSTNAVISHTGVSTTDMDEMSLDFIKTRYAYIGQFTLLASNAPGDLLYSLPVGLGASLTTAFSKGFTFTPVGYLLSIFNRYRGGFKIRMKFVKTEFQRFRIDARFTPYSDYNIIGAYAAGEMVYRTIFDASTTSEIEFCIPYLLVEAWQISGKPIGRFDVYLENALQAPTAVANNVPCLIEICADDDMMFAIPTTNPPYEPYWPSTNQADAYVADTCVTLGPTRTKIHKELTAYTMGEDISSLRQLIKRLSFWDMNGSNITIGPNNTAQIWPYVFGVVTQAAGTGGALTRQSVFADVLTSFAFMYAFTTGSVRMTFLVPSANSSEPITSFVSNEIGAAGTNTMTYNNTLITYPANSNISTANIEGCLEYSMPVWNTQFARSNASQIVVYPVGGDATTMNSTELLITAPTAASAFQIKASRIAGEDYSMFRWMGIPAMTTKTAT